MTSTTTRPYAEARETHAAVVLLVGDRAYKVKKPVDLGFLDFTTVAARERACRREVALNRRLAPDVYLGVAELHLPDRTREPVVVMVRMPDERRLSTLVRHRAAVDADLRELARRLATFHARSPRGPEIDVEGGIDRLRARWTDSFRQVDAFHGTVVDQAEAVDIERLTLRFLDGRGPLFGARVADGCIVDGHGDLIAEDVFCLEDGPRALDCLEFDDRLRYLDRVDDAAFLAVDLEGLDAGELGARFLGWYTEFAGDVAPPSLLHHYLAYRAFVRVKVACLRHDQGDPSAGGEARRLTSVTLRHLTDAAVTLTLVGGLPGTGKSTLAGAIADRFGMVVLTTDRVRKELAGLDATAPAASGYRQGIYTPGWTERTYAEVLHRADVLLGRGESVVVDASWTLAAHRTAARELARRTSSDLVEISCRAPTPVAAARMAARSGPSDADPAVAAALARDASRWPEAVCVDTGGSREAALLDAAALFGRSRQPARWRVRSPIEPD